MVDERNPRKTLADLMVVALTPALVIMMIASVAMFIYTIGYDGEYVKRGRFILFFFVTAVVLIARLSMDHGKEYAGLFAIPLILVMLFATKFSLIAMLGFGLVWWIAHQLTWNCTYIEDAEGDPGTGLLQVIGADRERMIDDDDQTSEIDETQSPEKESGGFADWWRRQIDRSHTQRTPGITVLYFAAVALPCFGFGQWFLGSEEKRRIGMWLVMGYLASGFGLLMTTAFLGLRRYLRRRHVPMPPEVATAWLAGGTVLTLLLLSVCLVLPRPRAPLSKSSAPFSFGGFNFQRWDKFGFGRDGYQQEDANREGNAPKTAAAGTENSKRKSNSGQQGNGKRQSKDNDKTGSKQAGQGKSGGESGSKGSENKNAKGSQSKKGSGGGGSKSNKRGEESSPSKDKSGGDQKAGSKGKKSAGNQQKKSDTEQDQAQGKQGGKGSKQAKSKNGDRRSDRRSSNSTSGARKTDSNAAQKQSTDRSSSQSWLSRLFASLGGIMRLLFYLILAIAVIYLIWRFRHQLAEGWRNLVSDFRAWLQRWFGSKEKAQAESEVSQPDESIARRRFSEFHDPFRQGLAEKWPAAEVVRYTFDAIEAWGGEQSIDRNPDETPSEYLEQLGTRFPQMEVELSHLGELYGQVAYAADHVNPKEALSLQRLWQCLDPSVNSGNGQTRFQ